MKTKKNKGRRKAKPLTKAEWTAEQELRNKLQTERWPNGFVCPHCGWSHTAAWARKKAEHIRERFRGPRPDLDPQGLRQTWYLKNGNIKCQACKRHISLTTGTVLEGIQQKFKEILRAAGIFIQAEDGISHAELAAKTGISPTGVCNLIKKFQTAMAFTPEDLLEGEIQIDECELVLRPAKAKYNIHIPVAIAVENRGGTPGRIALEAIHKDKSYSWFGYMDMIKKKSSVEPRMPNIDIEGLEFSGFKVKPTPKAGANEPLPLCTVVFNHVSEMIRRKYRGAIDRENAQGYLNEFTFRWNNVRKGLDDNREPAANILLKRLLKPPYKKPPHDKEMSEYLSWLAMP